MADVLGLKADEKGLELLFSAAPDLPRRLVGDPTRLRQVLVNLGSNAIKFTDARRGDGRHGDRARRTPIAIELHGWVRDTGVGLERARQLARLFQPFVQADSSTTRRFGGTGLGLVISRQLVERMGGRLWVDSAPGRGLDLPLHAPASAAARRARRRAPGWPASCAAAARCWSTTTPPRSTCSAGMLEALGVDRRPRARAARRRSSCVGAEPARLHLGPARLEDAGHGRRANARAASWSAIRSARPVHPAGHRLRARRRVRAGAGLPLAGVLHKPVTPSSLYDCLLQARRAAAAAGDGAARDAATRRSPTRRAPAPGRRARAAGRGPPAEPASWPCELLRRAGIEVVVAEGRPRGARQLAADGPFDGVLMDCQMPVMDGYTATRELRADPRWQRLPVIAMTASALADDRERALASGMNAHITKPIDVEVMLRTMAQWIVGAGRAAAGRPSPPAATGRRRAAGDARGDSTRADGLARCLGKTSCTGGCCEASATTKPASSPSVGAALDERALGAMRCAARTT